jgi:hypothetical protein
MSEIETKQSTHVLLHEHSTRCEVCGAQVKGWDTASPPPSICYGGPPSGDEPARLYLRARKAEKQLVAIAQNFDVREEDDSKTLADTIILKIQALTDDNDDRAYYTGMAHGFKQSSDKIMSVAIHEFGARNDSKAILLRDLAGELVGRGVEIQAEASRYARRAALSDETPQD